MQFTLVHSRASLCCFLPVLGVSQDFLPERKGRTLLRADRIDPASVLVEDTVPIWSLDQAKFLMDLTNIFSCEVPKPHSQILRDSKHLFLTHPYISGAGATMSALSALKLKSIFVPLLRFHASNIIWRSRWADSGAPDRVECREEHCIIPFGRGRQKGDRGFHKIFNEFQILACWNRNIGKIL